MSGYYCNACGKTFGNLTLFDWHQVGKPVDVHPHYGRTCRNSFHLALHGAVYRKGRWVIPMSDETARKLRGL